MGFPAVIPPIPPPPWRSAPPSKRHPSPRPPGIRLSNRVRLFGLVRAHAQIFSSSHAHLFPLQVGVSPRVRRWQFRAASRAGSQIPRARIIKPLWPLRQPQHIIQFGAQRSELMDFSALVLENSVLRQNIPPLAVKGNIYTSEARDFYPKTRIFCHNSIIYSRHSDWGHIVAF